MKSTTRQLVTTFGAVFLSYGMAFGADLDIDVVSNDENTVYADPGSVVDYAIRGWLTPTNDNLGLAGFALDLSFDGGALPAADTPTTGLMVPFTRPDGLTNPGGFGGTSIAGTLVQVGGAQNTIDNQISPYPVGNVTLLLGHTVLDLVTGSLTVPMQLGAYTLSVTSLQATVITLGEEGPVFATEFAGVGTITNLTIVVCHRHRFGDIYEAREIGAFGCESGVAELGDVLWVLDGFSAGANWGSSNPGADLLTTADGQNSDCALNGIVNLDDILAVLNAFQGIPDCCSDCPCSPCS